MATQYSNKPIVTDGLVYALDFGNQKSYVNGSSSAYNLKFNPITSSVVSKGGLPLPPITGGKLIEFLRGSNSDTGSYIDLNLNAGYMQNLLTYGKTYTVFFTGIQKVNTNLLTTGRLPDNQLTFNSQAYNYVEYDGNSIFSLRIDPKRQYENINTVSVVAHRQSSGSFDFYVNGVPQVPTSAGGSSQAGTGPTISGRPGQYDQLWSGSLGVVLIYDKALTDDEIWQNTQVLAPRYGISLPSNKPYAPLDPHAYLFLSQSGIIDPIITSSIDTFVRGLKINNLWDKMFAIYPFVGTGSAGTNLTGSHRWNLKEPASFTYGLTFSGSWNGSTSGSTPSGSNTYISAPNLQPGYTNAFSVPMPINRSNVHMSILSYDTPVSSSYLMGTGMTEDLAISTLAGDYGTPAAAYSVRKVRTAYSGALMDVRRNYDNVTSSIGYVSNGDLDTGSLLDWVVPGRNTLPGTYSGLAAAYSLRRVSSSYSGSAIQANNGLIYRDIGFDASGNLNTGSLTSLIATGSNVLAGDYSGLAAAYSLRKVVPGYAGDVIEVQSGSVSQSIGFDSLGNLDTGSLLTFAGSGNAFVKTWYDQSGNNNHATQSVAVNQPQIVNTGSIITENQKPNLFFNGTTSFLLTANSIISTDFSVYAVAKTPSAGSNRTGFVLSQYAVNDANRLYFAITRPSDLTIGVQIGGQLDFRLTNLNFNQQLYYWNRTGSNIEFAENSASIATATNSTIAQNSRLGLGGFEAGQRSLINMQEVLVYTSSQASNRTYIENNINAYYDIYTTSSTSTENAFVNTWYDQSGNGRHATQTATGSQPLIVSSGSLITENGKSAIRFDGINDHLINTNPLTYGSFSTFLTTKFSGISPTAQTPIQYSKLDISQLGLSYSPTVVLQSSDSTVSPIATASFSSTWTGSLLSISNITTFDSVYTTSSLSVNGTIVASGSRIVSSPSDGITIGLITSLPATTQLTGSISEIVIYNGSLTGSKILIENNINNYYNIYTGSNHGFVARWYDQSGNGHHFQQPLTASQPLIVSSGSYLGSVNLDGVDDWMNSLTSYTTSNQNSIFTVFKNRTKSSTAQKPLLTYNQNDSGIFNSYSIGNTWAPVRNNNLLREITFTSGFGVYSFHRTGNGTAAEVLSAFTNTVSSGTPSGGTPLSTNSPALTYLGRSNSFDNDFNIKEIIIYTSSRVANREPIEYGINSYYNIYPQTSSFATSSFTIKADSGSISGSLNNRLTSGIAASGPLGLITVSRTGSNSLTIARNGVTSSFSVPASGALPTGIYLGAINNNGLALGNSPVNISFASVGTGLTNSETLILDTLVGNLTLNSRKLVTDSDAYNFLAAANVLGVAEQIAINTLVTDLKSYGIWNKVKVIYPMVGKTGVSSSFEFNLKDPNKFRGTFTSGWTFANTGVTPNGTGAYMNTNIILQTDLFGKDSSIAYYSRTDSDGLRADIGSFGNSAVNSISMYSRLGNEFYLDFPIETSRLRVANLNSLGMYNANNNSTVGRTLFKNGTKITSSAFIDINFPVNANPNLIIGSSYGNTRPSNREIAFASMGSALSDTEAANFYTAVQRFQTTLGRQV
jgi:hypothetical protein